MNTEKVPVRLMIPGPVEVHQDVLEAMSAPIEPHYGMAWVETHNRIIDLLKQVFNTNDDVFLLAGSGTCALDACMGSSLQTGDKIIIANNGFFGDRLVEIAELNGLEVVQVETEWGRKIMPDMMGSALIKHPDARAAAVVHSETSTTVINPINEIGEVFKGKDVLYIVDAVSALGGLPYEVDEWGIDMCASASQKCLGAPPGLAPVSVSPKAWEIIEASGNRAHGWFTNLQIWRKYRDEWGDWHPTPVTMPVSLSKALLVSLTQLMEEGIQTRMARYREMALALREGLREAGMAPYTSDDELNPVLTAAYAPEGRDSSEVVQYLLEEHNIQISGGLGPLRPVIFRIGHMSPVLKMEDIAILVNAIKSFK